MNPKKRTLLGGTVFWWPAIMRAALFAFVSALTVFLGQADKMTYEQVQQYAWWDWLRFIGPVVIALSNTIISFLDNTMSKLRHEDDEETRIFKAKELRKGI